jgi:hypothetical protein
VRFNLVAAAAAGAIGLAAVACTASTAPGRTAAAGQDHARHPVVRYLLASQSVRHASAATGAGGVVAPAPAPGAFGHRFGTGCGELPRLGGAGAPRGLARLPVVTAMARAPALSDLVRALRLAGLAGQLNSAPGLTVFAPDNSAFLQLGSGNLQALFTTRSDLVAVMKFQVVAGRVRPIELARQRVLTTLGGTKIYPARADPSYFVNNAWITCGNLRTANATVYVVNRVVIPAT